jgi:thymidylate kinase
LVQPGADRPDRADRGRRGQADAVAPVIAADVVICDRYVESSLVLQRIDAVSVDFILP